MKQLELPEPIKHSKYLVGIVCGIPTDDCIANIRTVKGIVKKQTWTYIKEFVSNYFECPICKKEISVKVGWTNGLHTRSSKCPKCKALFCLIFENDPNWCAVCKVRKLECIRKYILLVEVFK